LNASDATPTDPNRSLRRSIYALLIAISVGQMCGDILAINSLDKVALEKTLVTREVARQRAALVERGEPIDEAKLAEEALAIVRQQRPCLSANDRSRWDTVRALVELGTYEIDAIQEQPGWDTIDMVRHPGWDGKPHLYSSKPPLLATIMAGPYWLIYQFSGKTVTLGTHPFEIGRALLILFNVLPMIGYFCVLAFLAERWASTDWGRIAMLATACFGTFLSLFAVSVNNHIYGAVCAAIVLAGVMLIWYEGRRQWWLFALVGFFAAFMVACELPALSLFVAVTVPLLVKAPRQMLFAYLPAAAVVFASFFGTNYLAHGTVRPAYSFRSDTNPEQDWYKFNFERGGKVRPSYWSNPQGIDVGEKSPAVYAFHALIGHHGIFSLTPIWLLSAVGLAMMLTRKSQRDLALVIAAVSIVCVTFYLFPPKVIDRNYGGMTSGFRWAFWLAPLWLVAMLPALDWLSTRKLGRGLTLALLAISALSVAYPWQPWKHPWIADFLLHLGWIHFP
jgi:hypothetical protein